MLGLSDAARSAIISGSVRPAARVDLYLGATAIRLDVPLSSSSLSSVTVDETATTRRACVLNFAPDAAGESTPLVPLLGGPVEPVGTEAVVYVDLNLPDGTVETLQLGVFGLRRPEASQRGTPAVTVAGRDRSQRVIDAVLTVPVDIAAGVNYATAIRSLIDGGVPGLVYVGFDEATTSFASPVTLHFADGDNRWQRATEMATSAGKTLFFDNLGQLVLLDVVNPATAPLSWSYTEGETNIATDIVQVLDADQTYSHAAVVGQSTDGSAPVRADAYDNDPASPTYYLGPFGDRVVRLSSSYIGTQAQADAAAAALLLRSKGIIEDVEIDAFTVYAHDAGDLVAVSSTRMGIDAFYVVSKFPMPLGPGKTKLTMRSRRI